ncbi:MAG: hypothetical protein KGL39_41085 [Patescibacteria group bacterium]|nr:hypothetical protein [Patescibacteria group bacterium]
MKIKQLTILVSTFLLVTSMVFPVFGQKPDPKATVKAENEVPQLSTTEKLALQQLGQQYTQLSSEFAQFSREVLNNHPGWQLNPATPFSGNLIKVPVPANKSMSPKPKTPVNK